VLKLKRSLPTTLIARGGRPTEIPYSPVPIYSRQEGRVDAAETRRVFWYPSEERRSAARGLEWLLFLGAMSFSPVFPWTDVSSLNASFDADDTRPVIRQDSYKWKSGWTFSLPTGQSEGSCLRYIIRP